MEPFKRHSVDLHQCYVDGNDICGTRQLQDGRDIIDRLPFPRLYPDTGNLIASCCGERFIIRSWRK